MPMRTALVLAISVLLSACGDRNPKDIEHDLDLAIKNQEKASDKHWECLSKNRQDESKCTKEKAEDIYWAEQQEVLIKEYDRAVNK